MLARNLQHGARLGFSRRHRPDRRLTDRKCAGQDRLLADDDRDRSAGCAQRDLDGNEFGIPLLHQRRQPVEQDTVVVSGFKRTESLPGNHNGRAGRRGLGREAVLGQRGRDQSDRRTHHPYEPNALHAWHSPLMPRQILHPGGRPDFDRRDSRISQASGGSDTNAGGL